MSSTINYWSAIHTTPPTLPAQAANLISFGPISFEPRAQYKGRDKQIHTFDQAKALVASKGLVLPTFRDVMEYCVIPGLEGKLNAEQQKVFSDMFASYGEWTDNAFHIVDDNLY